MGFERGFWKFHVDKEGFFIVGYSYMRIIPK